MNIKHTNKQGRMLKEMSVVYSSSEIAAYLKAGRNDGPNFLESSFLVCLFGGLLRCFRLEPLHGMNAFQRLQAVDQLFQFFLVVHKKLDASFKQAFR